MIESKLIKPEPRAKRPIEFPVLMVEKDADADDDEDDIIFFTNLQCGIIWHSNTKSRIGKVFQNLDINKFIKYEGEIVTKNKVY